MMTALNQIGLILLLIPMALAYAVGRHDGPVKAVAMVVIIGIAAAYFGIAGALVAG